MPGNKGTGLTRRDFAKLGAAAAAGFTILSSQSGRAETNSDTLKVGLLGCGNRGTGAAMEMLRGNPNMKLIAMADLFEDRLSASRNRVKNSKNEQTAKSYAVEDDHCFVGLDAYKKILATDIDILVEGTLPYSRPKHIMAAIQAGKHLFTEKPAAVDPVGIRQVIEAAKLAKEKNLTFGAGTQRRHQKEYVETIKKIHDGAIGDIVAMRAYWCGGLPFCFDRKEGWSDFEYRVRNWYGYCWVCGDNIVEQHVHNLDVCNWALNSHPESVFASGGRAWKPHEEKFGDLWDNFSCDFEYPNGVHVISFSRHWNGLDEGVFEEAVGTKGRSSCRDMGEKGEDPYVQEHIDVVNSIRGTGPYLNEGVQVAESTLTAIMGRMSAYTGKKITWDEAMSSDLSIVPAEWDFSKPYPVGPIPVPPAKL
ncbi:MAG: Gfo/Idh/MocA family oxidoreductase [Candidatus Omnitrophica bacterium]|nr:Gfo/Idh/MocA family oxidoreductase [Candidatus Omnitrophota bacterium]